MILIHKIIGLLTFIYVQRFILLVAEGHDRETLNWPQLLRFSEIKFNTHLFIPNHSTSFLYYHTKLGTLNILYMTTNSALYQIHDQNIYPWSMLILSSCL